MFVAFLSFFTTRLKTIQFATASSPSVAKLDHAAPRHEKAGIINRFNPKFSAAADTWQTVR
jgi:hypothetical protein